ncbi:MAG: IclR family transcriptional regulator [Acidobacteriia bacterium]|nr:IclR family transcriptional regulator [Terriglobia bacterium]
MRTATKSQVTPSIQSLDRGLLILEAVGKSASPVSLGELTELLGIDRSSVFRLANTLKRRGFLSYPAGRRDYILGPAIWRLSHRYDWGQMLIKISHEQLKLLATRTNETSHLAIREGRQALFIDHVASGHLIGISGQTGELVPLHSTAHGKALLADCDLQDLKRIFGSGPLRSYTKSTIVTLKQLSQACAEAKEQGYAIDDGEYQEGIRCVAAPIRAADELIIGAIGISAPALRFPVGHYPACAQQVIEAAREIQTLLDEQSAHSNGKG